MNEQQLAAVQLALEALNSFPNRHLTPFISDARKSLRNALEQAHAAQPAPVQSVERGEPVAWVDWLPEGTTHIAKCTVTTSSGGSLSLRTYAFKYEADALKVYTTDNDNEYPGWIDAKDAFYRLNFTIVPLYTTTPPAAPVQDRTPWIFRDRRGEKYTPKDQTYTPQEAAMAAVILGHESIGPAWLNAPAPQDAQPAPTAAPVESPDDWSDWKVTPPAQPTPVQKPDAMGCKCSECGEWQRWTPSGMVYKNGHGGVDGINHRLYTTPPATQKPWVGLTNNEIALINADYPNPQGFARAIEAKLKEKNT